MSLSKNAHILSITIFFVFLSFFLFFPGQVFAANIAINEFMANPPSGQGEWVELYNPTGSTVTLTGWKLIDGSNNTKSLDSLGAIQASGFIIYEYASDGWLNNTASGSKPETITLKDNNGSLIDSYSYTVDQKENVTTGRSPDGSSTWIVLAAATKGLPNSQSEPTATSTPTPTPSQVPTSTPTPTSKPTATIKPAATATFTPTPSPKQQTTTAISSSPTPLRNQLTEEAKATNETIPTSVLGDSTASAALESLFPSTQSSKSVKMAGATNNIIGKIIMGIGVVFVIVSGILAFRRYKKNRDDLL